MARPQARSESLLSGLESIGYSGLLLNLLQKAKLHSDIAYVQVQNHILGTGNSISNWQQFTEFCEELILRLAVLLSATWGALQQSAES